MSRSEHTTLWRPVDWLRRHLLLVIVVEVALLALLVFLMVRAAGGGPALVGTDLGKQPAPDFTLVDHRGETVSLSDFRGKAVALAFIYTNCPDVCPLIAENLRVAQELLSEEARDDVALLAVTVDPARDTPAALQAFSERHRLADNPSWHALRGDPATLERIWRAYGVYPGTGATPAGEAASAGGGEGHTDAIYLIDPEGRLRVFLRSDATPRVLADNLQALVDELSR
ncbi:MAG: SCO family protein [Thermomicrobiales bacterium]